MVLVTCEKHTQLASTSESCRPLVLGTSLGIESERHTLSFGLLVVGSCGEAVQRPVWRGEVNVNHAIPPVPSSHGRYIKAIELTAKSVRDLAGTGHRSRVVSPTPRAESLAVAELSQQENYAGDWDSNPVDAALSQVGLLLYAAEDCMSAFASLVLSEETPLYAHVTLARSALESLALGHFLADPTIGIKERIRRSLNQRIYEAYQAERLPPDLRKDQSVRKRLLLARALGFETRSKKGGITYLLPDRPTITRQIRDLLGHDDLGVAVYGYASAVSHGVGWGLLQRQGADVNQGFGEGPMRTVALMHSSEEVNMMALLLIVGHIKAYGAYLAWTGIPAGEWKDSHDQAMHVVRANLHAMDSRSHEADSGGV